MHLEYDTTFGRFVQAGPVRLHYGDAGEAHGTEPVIFLHGTGPGANGWVNFRHNAGALADRYRVLVLDLPRFGRSEKVALPGPRLDVLSTVVGDFMAAVDVPRAHFFGNSMGGQVALKLAIDAPERVGRLLLVAPAPLARSAFTAMPTEVVRLIAGYYADEGPSFEKMRQLMRALVYDPTTVTPEAVRERYEASVAPDVLAANAGPSWAHQSLEHELHRVQAPALLVWGQDDRASPLDHALQLLRVLPASRLHVFSRCGHSAQSEYPAEVNALALDFFAAGRSPAPAEPS